MTSKPRPKFRIVRCYDKAVIKRLHKLLFADDRFYDAPSFDWIVLNEAGKTVGFCMLGDWAPGVGFLARAGILKSARGHGLHRRLITVRERHARRAGIKVMASYTAIESVPSSLNLERAGYKLATLNPAPAGNWLCWKKQLIEEVF